MVGVGAAGLWGHDVAAELAQVRGDSLCRSAHGDSPACSERPHADSLKRAAPPEPSFVKTAILAERRNAQAFWVGCALVTAGVILHLPMFVMARHSGYVLAGMTMDGGMLLGMAAIVIGIGVAGYGLLPKSTPLSAAQAVEALAPPEDAPLTRAHWGMAALLGLALIIDIMKPASLGFVTPGMRVEYGVGGETVAWLPFAALTGTVLGSFVWGLLASTMAPLRFAANVNGSVVGERHDGRHETVATSIANDGRQAVLHVGDEAIGGAEIDADDFTHKNVGFGLQAPGFEPRLKPGA